MYKDKVDEKIIGYLKEDSRESFVDIGKKLKLSESAANSSGFCFFWATWNWESV